MATKKAEDKKKKQTAKIVRGDKEKAKRNLDAFLKAKAKLK